MASYNPSATLEPLLQKATRSAASHLFVPQGIPMPTEFLFNLDPHALIQAAGNNQREWLARFALASEGEVKEMEAATWTYSPRPKAAASLAFPHFSEADAGEQIDAFLEFCRQHRPVHELSCWIEASPQPWDLGARLVARGFNWGWQPHWMGLDLEGLDLDSPAPEEVKIGELEVDSDWGQGEFGHDERATAPFKFALTRQQPQSVWVFVATMEGRVVGHCSLNLTDGPLGAAGIYDVGVARSSGRRGIGRALVHLACRTARGLGCRFAVLNSANDPFWLRLGFRSLDCGQTWWLREESLEQETLTFAPPSPDEIAFVEAVGRGDVSKLDELGSRKTPDELNAKILGRYMSLVDLAVEMGQPASIEWLVKHGASPPLT